MRLETRTYSNQFYDLVGDAPTRPHQVKANNKEWARIKVLKTVVRRLNAMFRS
jgi:hypothetical protein